MAVGQQPADQPVEAPDTGSVVKETTRSIQKLGKTENCLGVNIPAIAATIHRHEVGDESNIVVYENGIWIPRE